MSTIYCRLSYGSLSFRPETLAVPSEVTFEVSGLPAGRQCDLIIAEPRKLTPLASAQITAAGRCTINTNTDAFRALFSGDHFNAKTVLVQIGTPSELLASGLVVARWNMLASDDVPPAPAPNTRWLTDADYRDLASSIAGAKLQASEDVAALTVRLDEQAKSLKDKADAATLAAVTERVNALEKKPTIDEAILMRVRAFDANTATVDGLWQQVADLSTILSALVR